ncbi:MAG TPA: hypothetical protein VH500_18790 [Nitrososphaeraceae archaeon]
MKHVLARSLGWDKIGEQRFDKQKELGIWPSNMSLPVPHLAPLQPWNTLSPVQRILRQRYSVKVHAAMMTWTKYWYGSTIPLLLRQHSTNF